MARPVGGPVGVEVSPGREPLRDAVRQAQGRARGVGAVEGEERELRLRVAGPGPVAEQEPFGVGLAFEDRLLAVREQDPGPFAAPARLHVLDEDQRLLAGGLDHRLQVAPEDHRRGLEVRFVGHLHRPESRAFELRQRVVSLDELVPGEPRDGLGPLGVGGDEPDVEGLHASEGLLLAEVRFGVEPVRGEAQAGQVAGRDPQVRDLVRSEGPRGDDLHRRGPQDRGPAAGHPEPGAGAHQEILLDGPGRVPLDLLEDRPDLESGVVTRLGLREPGDQGLQRGDRLVRLPLDPEALADAEQGLGAPGVERVLGDELTPGGPGLGELAILQQPLGPFEAGGEDGLLGPGRAAPVGISGQVIGPRGDGLVELALSPQDLADLEPGGRREFGRESLRLLALGPVTLALQEGPERGDRALGPPPGLFDCADLVGRLDGQRMGRRRGEDPSEGRDLEVEILLVGREQGPVLGGVQGERAGRDRLESAEAAGLWGRDGIGPGDQIQGPGPEVGFGRGVPGRGPTSRGGPRRGIRPGGGNRPAGIGRRRGRGRRDARPHSFRNSAMARFGKFALRLTEPASKRSRARRAGPLARLRA